MHGVTNVIVARMINRMFLSISVTDTSYHIMIHVLVKKKLYAGIPMTLSCMDGFAGPCRVQTINEHNDDRS